MRRSHELMWIGAMATLVASCKRDAKRTEASSDAPSASVAVPTDPARTKVTAEATAMGTRLTFVALTSPRVDEAAVHAAIEKAIEEVRRLESLMTTWRDDSELSQVNRAAGRSPVLVSH